MPINVVEAWVGENPEQPNALNRLRKRRPGWLIYLKIPPQPNGSGGIQATCGSAPAKQNKTNKRQMQPYSNKRPQ